MTSLSKGKPALHTVVRPLRSSARPYPGGARGTLHFAAAERGFPFLPAISPERGAVHTRAHFTWTGYTAPAPSPLKTDNFAVSYQEKVLVKK